MTEERELPKPEDALAYLINRIIPGTTEDAAGNISRAIESLRNAVSELARLRESLPEWLCRECNTVHTPPGGFSLMCKTPGCLGVLKPSTFAERRLQEKADSVAKDLDVLAAQIAAAGIPGFGKSCRDIAYRLREASDGNEN